MPISSTDIANRMRQVGLDAEGADYYNDARDIIPAINAAIEWSIAVINSAMESNKFQGEILREIVRTRIFQPSDLSRISFVPASMGNDVIWTILAVYPEASTYPENPTYTSLSTPVSTVVRTDLSYTSSDYNCKRLTLEEWNSNKNNPFVAGSNLTSYVNCPEIKQYAYLNYNDYTSSGYVVATAPQEIEIRPSAKGQYVAVTYLKMPSTIGAVLGTNDIEFPDTMTNLLYSKSLQYVSYKQGDYSGGMSAVTTRDINTLIQTIF